jgi:hypothetical protein
MVRKRAMIILLQTMGMRMRTDLDTNARSGRAFGCRVAILLS